MVLGVEPRGVGESCWTHAQCRHGVEHTYCKGLICVCEKGFHKINNRCSRNIWDDMGVQYWQLMALALVATLILMSVFFLSLYMLIKKFIWYKRQKINPLENIFAIKSNSSVKSVREGIAYRRKSLEMANLYLYEDEEDEMESPNWATPPCSDGTDKKVKGLKNGFNNRNPKSQLSNSCELYEKPLLPQESTQTADKKSWFYFSNEKSDTSNSNAFISVAAGRRARINLSKMERNFSSSSDSDDWP